MTKDVLAALPLSYARATVPAIGFEPTTCSTIGITLNLRPARTFPFVNPVAAKFLSA
jgi:hypothetical protein